MPLLSDPVHGAAGAAGATRARARSRPRRCRPMATRRARWATRTTAWSTSSASCRRPPVGHGDARRRADLDALAAVTQNQAVFKGRGNYLNPTARRRSTRSQELLWPGASTSRRPGSRCSRVSTCRRRSRGARASTATPRCCSAATRARATIRRASPPTSTRSTGSTLKYIGYYGNYTTTGDRRSERRPTAPFASLSDRGWCR